ncbi:MAG TPA: YggS family pyridoxal phosphate-dependent enzyme [Frankiaceae bacterium]|nr:YggS family pyridoxal phosphate-dependent enzyme [Frankiaceae bacterium]
MAERASDARAVRRDELEASLAALNERIARACDVASRDPAAITLIAVTKTFPASDIRLLAELGATDVGENRDEEAAGKHAECADLPLVWHFVGQVQRRKARSIASYADVVHSIDRAELAVALGAAASAAGRVVAGLVQVSLDASGIDGRGGAAPDRAADLAEQINATAGLALAGVMGVAPLGGDPGPAFERLAEVSAQVRARFAAATVISAGMSGDLEAAIRHGATHLRVGTALLGGREALVG